MTQFSAIDYRLANGDVPGFVDRVGGGGGDAPIAPPRPPPTRNIVKADSAPFANHDERMRARRDQRREQERVRMEQDLPLEKRPIMKGTAAKRAREGILVLVRIRYLFQMLQILHHPVFSWNTSSFSFQIWPRSKTFPPTKKHCHRYTNVLSAHAAASPAAFTLTTSSILLSQRAPCEISYEWTRSTKSRTFLSEMSVCCK